MTAEKEYMIYLISCFLSGTQPEGRIINWETVFRLADINDVGAIIASQIKKLPEEFRPTGKTKSEFNQLLGYAVRNYEVRSTAFDKLCAFLNANRIEHLFVKGIVLNKYYPVPELRSSGDIDVIVRSGEFKKVCGIIKSKGEACGIVYDSITPVTAMFRINGKLIEIHRDADVPSEYFSDIFAIAEKSGEYLYSLDNYNHLLYVILHLAKHLSEKGAGIRMAADVDVLIRNTDGFDIDYFFKLCEKSGYLKTAKAILGFCVYGFKTPINGFDASYCDKTLFESLGGILLESGSFGNITGSKGTVHLNNTNASGNVNALTRFKTLVRFVFPPVGYIRGYYTYSVEHSALIPLAYVNRIFDAAFKRRKTSLKTIKEIRNLNDNDAKLKALLSEIGIENNNRSKK